MNNTVFNVSMKINETGPFKILNITGKAAANGTAETVSDLHLPLVLLGVLSSFIIAANSLVIVLVYKNKQLQTVTNLYLAFLASCDLLSGLVAIPLIFACNLMPIAHSMVPCIAMNVTSRFIAFSTILHLVIVTFESYVMLIYPMHYHRIVSKKRMAASVIIIWGFSLTASLIHDHLLWINLDQSKLTETDERYIDKIYSYNCFVWLVALSSILLGVVYVRIFQALRYQLKKIRRQVSHITSSRHVRHKRGQQRTVTIFALMIFAFILGWFSYFFSGILHDEDVEINIPPAVNITLLFFRFGTSLFNPLLYALFKEDFKAALKSHFYKYQQIWLDEIPLSTSAGSCRKYDA